MTLRFILDENVLICAQTGTNDQSEIDPTCADLVNRIIRICHTMVIDTEQWDKYQSQLNQSRNQNADLGPIMLRVLQ